MFSLYLHVCVEGDVHDTSSLCKSNVEGEVVGAYASVFWDSMSHARLCSEFIILLETLA